MNATISRHNLMRIFAIKDERTFDEYVRKGYFKRVEVNHTILYDVNHILERLNIANLNEPFITSDKVAEMLRMSEQTIRVKAAQGALPYYQFEKGERKRMYFLASHIKEHMVLAAEFRYEQLNRIFKLMYYKSILYTLLDTKTFSSGLNERENELMKEYLIDNNTVRQIARKYKISKQRVSQIVEAACDKLLNKVVKVKDLLNAKEPEEENG